MTRSWYALVGGLASALACGERQQQPPPARDLLPLDQVIEWGATITLEETEDVINVAPRVSPDAPAGYLVADMKEYQVRIYGPQGALRGAVGREGGGPGEFSVPPMAAIRLQDRTVLAVDFSGAITLLDTLGAEVRSTHRVPLTPLYGAVALPDSDGVLLIGRGSPEAGSPLLHVWSRRLGAIERSLLPAPLPEAPGLSEVVWPVTHAHASLRDGLLGLVFATDPAVHLVRLDGWSVQRIPIPFGGFRSFRAPGDVRSAGGSGDWLQAFSRVSDVFWLGSDTLLVTYYDVEGMELHWSLIGMSSNGRKLFEATDTPRLLTVLPESNELVFVHPTAEAPNRWILARLRSVVRE